MVNVAVIESVHKVSPSLFFMLVDFDTIERCVTNQVDEKYEWMAAWGLAYTILYIYFKILRIKHVKDYDKIDCTIHMFEWDGVFYGRMFRGDEKGYYSNYFFAVNNKDDRPAYFAHGSRNVLCVYFYEYPCDDRVNTTCYLYHPNSEFTSAGLRADWDAPMGAQNSPVTISRYDQPYTHIDYRNI